jgi:hypothetical protein
VVVVWVCDWEVRVVAFAKDVIHGYTSFSFPAGGDCSGIVRVGWNIVPIAEGLLILVQEVSWPEG